MQKPILDVVKKCVKGNKSNLKSLLMKLVGVPVLELNVVMHQWICNISKDMVTSHRSQQIILNLGILIQVTKKNRIALP